MITTTEDTDVHPSMAMFYLFLPDYLCCISVTIMLLENQMMQYSSIIERVI